MSYWWTFFGNFFSLQKSLSVYLYKLFVFRHYTRVRGKRDFCESSFGLFRSESVRRLLQGDILWLK
jgi:hypothetical protein